MSDTIGTDATAAEPAWMAPADQTSRPGSPARPAPDERFGPDERRSYVRSFGGHSMSTSLLAPGMRYFDVPGSGFVAYRTEWGATLALADPVCAPGRRGAVVDAFLAAHPRAGFVQVSHEVARELAGRNGLYATQLGVETTVELAGWTLAGRAKQVLRTALNAAERRGISVSEGASAEERAAVSRDWLATRPVDTEIAFLIRPMEAPTLPGARTFCARRDGRLLGFAIFDPIFEAGRVVGYVPNVSRASAAFSQGIFYAIVIRAMERFREEGVGFVNLGLSPLALDARARDSESRMLRGLLRALYRHGDGLYRFGGIRFAKSRFRGREAPMFVAHRRRLPLGQGLALLRLARLL